MFLAEESAMEVGDALELFVGYLLAARRVTSYSTISSYLSAVSALHVDVGLESPTQEARKAGRLHHVFQGLQRVLTTAKRSPPVTVLDLRPATRHAFETGKELQVALAALTVLAATAMLRVHEYVVCDGQRLGTWGLSSQVLSDEPDARAVARSDARIWKARQALRTRDVQVSSTPPGTLTIKMRAWKYGLTGAEHQVPIRCTSEWTACAHCCISRFLILRQDAGKGKPPQWLAQLSDGTFITEAQVSEYLQEAARSSGLAQWQDCTPHSLRRGGATQLYQVSKDKTMVREVGRWRSETGVDPYLVVHTDQYHDAWDRAVVDPRSQGEILGSVVEPRTLLASGGGGGSPPLAGST